MRISLLSSTPGMQGKSVCQFGKMCYRKNPVHFEEYSHPELEEIVLKGRDHKNEYDIPDDILAPRHDTMLQLNMIEKVLKKNLGTLPVNNASKASPAISPSPVPVAKTSSQSPVAKARLEAIFGSTYSATTPKRGNTQLNTSSRASPLIPIKTENNNNNNNKRPSDEVTIILDSDTDDDEDFKLAIELSKRQKLDSPKEQIQNVEKTVSSATPSTSNINNSTINSSKVIVEKSKEQEKIISKAKPTATSQPTWLSKPNTSSAVQSSSPVTPRRPVTTTPSLSRRPVTGNTATPTTSRPSSSSASSTTSRLEAKPKVTEGPRLVANDLTKVERRIEDYIDVLYPKGEAIKKYEASNPYNFFLTAIVDSPETHKEALSITMQEILDKSLGDLESSVQINFMVDIGWLLAHYYFAGHDHKPLLVLYGDETPELVQISTVRRNVTAIKINMSNAFATHHSKVMLLGYKDKSMRVVVSTANLYEDDWRNRTQGLWISPRCYEMEDHDQGHSSTGESVTGFRTDLIRYLNKYNQPRLQEWTARIQRTNFEAVKVFLVCSVPDSHQTLQNEPKWGHLRVGHLLTKHCAPVEDNCPLIAQSSSIGSLGREFNMWAHEISTSFCRDSGPARLKRSPGFKMVFPSYNNVLAGHDGLLSGGGLPYRRENHMKQRWLENHLQLWRANERYRTKALPHIKSYFRYSEQKGLFWFCLTSANFSKAAWGSVNKGQSLGQVLRVNNYEMGVLFLPKVMIERDTFPLKSMGDGKLNFPMPYDLPLVPYSIDDTPFFSDYLINAMQ